MNRQISSMMWAVALAGLIVAGTASAEVTVTVSINGSIDDILPILQHLRDFGIGVGAVQVNQDPLKLHVHSVTTREDDPAQTAAPEPLPEPEPAPKPDLALGEPALAPAQASPGSTVLLTVPLADKRRRVDTMGTTLKVTKPNGDVLQEFQADLYDNGSRGDVKANDGIWSRELSLPPSTPRGKGVIEVTAYNVNGEPVQVENDEGKRTPLTASGGFTVR